MVGYINTKNDAVWDLLRQLAPPEGVFASGPVHSSLSFLGETLGAQQIAIADPDAARVQMSKKVLGNSSEILTLESFVDSESRTRPYYELSIKSESGFIPADRLRPLWQNITEKSSQEVETQSILEVFASLEFKSNWLVLNRLDSIFLVDQIGRWPYRPDVLIIRALNEAAPHGAEELSNISKLETLLNEQNYRLITKISETHPHICQCVFLADWQKQAEAKSAELTETRKTLNDELAETRKTHSDELAEAKNTHSDELAEAKNTHSDELAEAKNTHSDELAETKKTLSDQIEKLDAKIAAIKEQANASEKNTLLAENNLADLRRQHETLSQTYIEQCSQMSEIKSLLFHLSALAAEGQ